eukprot:13341214-Alexandrium_andersonii.AAC.1
MDGTMLWSGRLALAGLLRAPGPVRATPPSSGIASPTRGMPSWEHGPGIPSLTGSVWALARAN